MIDPERAPWDRLAGEPARTYAGFRAYRDLAPLRSLPWAAELLEVSLKTVRRWSARWNWLAWAVAWDDETHRLDDAQRLEAIRTMHANHARAARAAQAKALAALAALNPNDIPAYAAARLLELGARLEREILTVSVEELQGVSRLIVAEDPWDAIARELQGDASP